MTDFSAIMKQNQADDRQPSGSSRVDFLDDEPVMGNDQRLFTDMGDEADEDEHFQVAQPRGRYNEQSPARGDEFVREDPWTTQNNISGQSSRANILDLSRQQDERIQRLAEQQN